MSTPHSSGMGPDNAQTFDDAAHQENTDLRSDDIVDDERPIVPDEDSPAFPDEERPVVLDEPEENPGL